MQRILIIGNAGSGKTTFAKKLAVKTGLPLTHLDQIYWRDNWEHLSQEEFDPILQDKLQAPQWIIDGNFHRTLPRRLACCDTVFFFDLPTCACLWGITKRLITNYGRSRDDMGGNCPEHFDRNKKGLYQKVTSFNRTHRKDYYNLLADATHAKTIVFRSHKDAEDYLNNLR